MYQESTMFYEKRTFESSVFKPHKINETTKLSLFKKPRLLYITHKTV